MPPFIRQEWAFASKLRVYGAWGGAGYDPTRVGAVQARPWLSAACRTVRRTIMHRRQPFFPACAQGPNGTRGTVYALDDVLIPPTTGAPTHGHVPCTVAYEARWPCARTT